MSVLADKLVNYTLLWTMHWKMSLSQNVHLFTATVLNLAVSAKQLMPELTLKEEVVWRLEFVPRAMRNMGLSSLPVLPAEPYFGISELIFDEFNKGTDSLGG
jgi:hypothetical protein